MRICSNYLMIRLSIDVRLAGKHPKLVIVVCPFDGLRKPKRFLFGKLGFFLFSRRTLEDLITFIVDDDVVAFIIHTVIRERNVRNFNLLIVEAYQIRAFGSFVFEAILFFHLKVCERAFDEDFAACLRNLIDGRFVHGCLSCFLSSHSQKCRAKLSDEK